MLPKTICINFTRTDSQKWSRTVKENKNTAHYGNVSVKWAFFSDSFGLRFFSYSPARCAKKAALCQEKYRENIFHSNSPQSHVCTDAPRWQRAAHTHSRRHRQTCTLPLCSPSHPLKTRERIDRWKEAVNHTRAPADWPLTWRWKKKLWETSKTWRLLWEKETETLNAQKEERSSTTPICSYTTVQNQYKDKDARQDINWSSLWNKTYYVLNIFMCLQPRGTSVGWNTDVNAATLSQLELFEPDK